MSVVRNTGYNLGAALVPIAVALITLPLYISSMGEARYGVLALVTTLIGYFGVFDFGLSAASAQRIASTPEENLDQRRAIFWTAAVVNLGLGILAALLLGPVAWWFFASTETLAPGLRTEILRNIHWIALTLPVLMLSAVLRGALQGAGRFAELNLINVFMGPATQIVPLVVAMTISPSLSWVLPALYLVRIVTLLLQGIVVISKVTRSPVPRLERRLVGDLLTFGGWVSLSAVAEPLLTTIDRMVIGSRLGMEAVSHYTLPAQLAQRSLVLPAALVDAMLPRLAGENDQKAKELSCRALRAVAATMTPPILAGMIWVDPFLELWLSRGFADAASSPARLMLLGCWFNALGFCCFQHLRARGRPKLVAFAHMLEILPYLTILYLLMSWFGIVGAAAAFAIRVFADDVILAHFGGIGRDLVRILIMITPAFALAGWLGENIHGIADLISLTSAAGAALVVLSGLGALLWLKGELPAIKAAFRKSVS
ncbi:flippase [Novosphingobium sp. TH158]|uniref:flippase n=1 Tax=Novosphingobium sp. TH158 TaxID=2067455 RepID=UPI0020B12861|nr:flippase [Novosphingobium sp. TH158]